MNTESCLLFQKDCDFADLAKNPEKYLEALHVLTTEQVYGLALAKQSAYSIPFSFADG